MKKNKTLIIGMGEIGKSLGEVLLGTYEVSGYDINEMFLSDGEFDIINICFPYSKDFIKQAREYKKRYKAKLAIIHSTVPVGTTRKLGKGFVHSPVNGKHPNLAKSILTFDKIIGGNNAYDVRKAFVFLTEAGMKVKTFANSDASELAKIMCTSYYGWNIVYMKEMVRLCEKYNVPFNQVYFGWNNNYNDGYKKLGETQFTRPILQPMEGKIGGHCVVNNCSLLDDTLITKTIKEYNDLLN